MSDEKSAAGETGGLQLEGGVAELRDSPDVQPDVGLVAEVARAADRKPELASFMSANASHCSEDPADMAEAVYLGRSEPEAAMWFKAHLEICPRCCQVYQETVEFVDAIRAADKELEAGDCCKAN